MSVSASEYHCEYHREYHFANIILKTENRKRRHSTETQQIFLLSTRYFSDCNGSPVRVQDLLLSTATVESSDCLIEGSAKDRVSHFILR